MNTHAYIELFHLLFLRQLEGNIDKKLYALKGGCNLRFFFKSIRYSEDIDFDIAIIAKQTLENKINKILTSVNFKKILQSKQIEILQFTPAKQTDTTQRWKILLKIKNSAVSIPTKIEFSRRKLDSGVEYQAVDRDLISQYSLYPIMCNHYEPNIAFVQKINALINRTETQARDIFDLKLLLDQKAAVLSDMFTKNEIQTAIDNLSNISYTDFKGQVVAYLMDEYKEFYGSQKSWDDICSQVLVVLEKMLHETH